MTVVRLVDGMPEIDAAVAARAMKFAVAYFLKQMRRGAIRGRVERGSGEDEGRHRLSFRHHDRELIMIVDEKGQIISQELIMSAPTPHYEIARYPKIAEAGDEKLVPAFGDYIAEQRDRLYNHFPEASDGGKKDRE
jgi:hypothetical protein